MNACFASGYRSLAIANYATAIGWRSKASGQYSSAFGFRSYSEATKSVSIGSLVKVTSFADRAIAIGCGGEEGSNYYLINGVPRSMMIGFSSIYPTLFISESTPSVNYDKTGKIAIGNVSIPIADRAKLHIRADAGEVANLMVEPNSWTAGSMAMIQLGNQYHGLIGSYDRGLEFKTQKNYVFNDGNLGIGTTNPIHLFQVSFNGSQFYLDNNTLTFEAQGGGNCPTIKLISSLRNTWNIKHDFTTSSLLIISDKWGHLFRCKVGQSFRTKVGHYFKGQHEGKSINFFRVIFFLMILL